MKGQVSYETQCPVLMTSTYNTYLVYVSHVHVLQQLLLLIAWQTRCLDRHASWRHGKRASAVLQSVAVFLEGQLCPSPAHRARPGFSHGIVCRTEISQALSLKVNNASAAFSFVTTRTENVHPSKTSFTSLEAAITSAQPPPSSAQVVTHSSTLP